MPIDKCTYFTHPERATMPFTLIRHRFVYYIYDPDLADNLLLS